ncbi:uncharacterized protein (TIGR00369 family) [Hasllibacter halocynthiae]|uniref:Uncharacterized protein (TIGR00369 family) n=1 Tax=Hasllibacter halocynthiae TaxID=595589 RepID=A0A2T0X6K6_9RHOB|nr:PaaI family thioesterase [Hasllibacter halocynthiae]PRY94525.1 uncharacterized protein (TIGR00369 family) [Hasllibacter halocynthiae]
MEEDDPRMRTARQFIDAIPHASALGMTVRAVGTGRVVVDMPWDERLIGDPARGVIHGGAVSALMDTTGGAAVISHDEAPLATATLGLRIDYMRAARPGEAIRAEAEVYHMTRHVAFVRATATDGGEGPVATATGTFTVERAPGGTRGSRGS